MKKESSNISVIDLEEGKILKTGFHDEFDALEWAEKNVEKGKKIVITTRRVIRI